VIVFDDVDVDACAQQLVIAKYRNAGQLCHSPTRFFVHRNVYAKFIDAFAEKASALRIGNGIDESTELGPLANERRLQAVGRMVEESLSHSRLITGGQKTGDRGYFYLPTVLA